MKVGEESTLGDVNVEKQGIWTAPWSLSSYIPNVGITRADAQQLLRANDWASIEAN